MPVFAVWQMMYPRAWSSYSNEKVRTRCLYVVSPFRHLYLHRLVMASSLKLAHSLSETGL